MDERVDFNNSLLFICFRFISFPLTKRRNHYEMLDLMLDWRSLSVIDCVRFSVLCISQTGCWVLFFILLLNICFCWFVDCLKFDKSAWTNTETVVKLILASSHQTARCSFLKCDLISGLFIKLFRSTGLRISLHTCFLDNKMYVYTYFWSFDFRIPQYTRVHYTIIL